MAGLGGEGVPKSMTWLSKEDDVDIFLGATPPVVGTGVGVVLRFVVALFLGVMVDWSWD